MDRRSKVECERLCAFEATLFTHRPGENHLVIELRRNDVVECEERRCHARAIVDRARGKSDVSRASRTLEAVDRRADLNASRDQCCRVETEPCCDGRRFSLRRAVAWDEDAAQWT